MSKPIVVVTGATGAQGGSVIKSLFKNGGFTVRALTRNIQSDAAKKLSQSYPAVQLVQGHFNDKESLRKAFQGAKFAFLVTNFWDPEQKMAADSDLVLGKNLADAAKESKLEFVVWSSLHDVASIASASGVQLNVPHFTNKNKVEQYIKSIGLPAAFVYAGFYADNWSKFPPFAPRRVADGSVQLPVAARSDVGLPIVDIEEDFGQFVAPLFSNPQRYTNAHVLAATEYLTHHQLAQAYTQVTGEKVKTVKVSLDSVPLDELKDTIKYWNAFGYYNGEDIGESHAQFDQGLLQLHTFQDWLARSGYKVPAASASASAAAPAST